MQQRCELYLQLRGDALPSHDELMDILRVATPSALLLTHVESETDLERLAAFLQFPGRQDLAVLVQDKVSVATALSADGVHATGGADAVVTARAALGEDASIGVSSSLSRHDAMTRVEAGADYIAFGDSADEALSDLDALIEMTQWWAELFEIPCALWLDKTYKEADISRIIEAGADFLILEAETAHGMSTLKTIRGLLQ